MATATPSLTIIAVIAGSVLLGVLILSALGYGIYQMMLRKRQLTPQDAQTERHQAQNTCGAKPLRNLSDEDDLSRSVIIGSVTTSSEQEDPFVSNSSSSHVLFSFKSHSFLFMRRASANVRPKPFRMD